MRWLDQHPQAGAAGVTVRDGVVVVQWKGEVPASMRRLSGAQPAEVLFVPAKYSAAELLAESARLAKANQATIATVGPSEDYSGLDVQLSSKGAAQRATINSSYPVSVTGAIDVAPARRDADTSPFWGGALIYRATSPTQGYVCGTGVSVYRGTTSGITTAWHCGTGTWTGYASGATLGTVTGTRSQAKDTQVITGSSTAGRIYTGPWDSSTSIPVYNAERPANNTGICTGGAVSGELCTQVTVRGTNMYTNITGVGSVGPGFWILSTGSNGGVQIGNVRGGDSGSPAFSYTSAGAASVKGFIVAIDGTFSTLNCRGNPNIAIGPNGFCYARSFAVNSVDALSAVGATIKVG
ncbi:hypothetical protein AB0M20_35615 [Actinoplanes sp. NPDC051633]|uniref:hypothetical protein n=1 Tax=Actinoplanes sp. NPDC051633 TaxID=3155670 RepID=UPI003420A8D6